MLAMDPATRLLRIEKATRVREHGRLVMVLRVARHTVERWVHGDQARRYRQACSEMARLRDLLRDWRE